MVDIIKFLPTLPTSIHRIPNRLPSEQITFPIFFSTFKNFSQIDRSTVLNNTKRWIGRCPCDPPRQVNISDIPFRKVIHREIARCYPTTTTNELPVPVKSKSQKNSSKESLKSTTVTSFPSLSSIETQSSRLFDALSKHVTIKPEPLRPANSFVNNSCTSSSSWQKYWSSTQTQRRRKEANDTESNLNRPKPEQPLLSTTHFITVRDSSFCTTTENNSNSRTPSTVPSSCTPTKLSSPIILDQQESFIKEENHFFLPEIYSPRLKNPTMNFFKPIEDKVLSPIQSEITVINDDKEIQNEVNVLTTKIYKLPLPSNKQKTNKPKRGSRSKSLDKKPIIPSALLGKKQKTITSTPDTSASKQKRQRSSNKQHRTSLKKQQSLATVMTTTPRSKYEPIKWEEPYVGVRFDPPTPPCSPSLFVWPQDSDQDENETSFEQISSNEVFL